MYRFSVWKLLLIITIFVFSVMYLIPTPDALFNPFYGNLPLWMQDRLPKFEVTEDSAFKVSLKDVDYRTGTTMQDAVAELEDVFRVHLGKLKFEEETDYQFEHTVESGEFQVKFLTKKSEAELETIVSNLHLYGSLPIGLRNLIPSERLKLGLDLKGGVRLALEVDLEESKSALLKERAASIPDQLQNDKILCRKDDSVIEGDGLNIIVGIPSRYRSDEAGKKDYLEKAEELLNEQEFFEPPKRISESDTRVTYQIQLSDSGIEEYSKQAIGQVLIVLRNRVDAFGVSEPSIRPEANRPRIIVELPGAKDSSKPLRIVRTMGRLEFKLVAQNPTGGNFWSGPPGTEPTNIPADAEILYHYETGNWLVLESDVLLKGDRVSDSFPTTGSTGFDIVVAMQFDSAGARQFARVTGDNIGRHLAIVLDGTVQSAPVIRSQISSNGVIEGNFSHDEASYLSNILKAGAFPVGVKIAEERAVGPTLGKESIENGIWAGVIGLGCVIVFMLIYYKLSGGIAVVALVFNMVIILGALAGFGAALTLPGIAGLILTIGMAVDANVLIFERIREELRTGKAVWSSIVSGYQRAFWTILDANLTTFFTALVLYHFGTGPIKGFAVTLGIGILASMFTAIVFTREMYGWLIGGREIKKLSI